MFRKRDNDSHKLVFENVCDGLKCIYEKILFPIEKTYLFHQFHSPALDQGDFKSKPMILLLGQYSTGKTSFIKYLLGGDFPGMRIGPEPTTDKFIVVMHGDEGVIPGNALVVDSEKQFRPLSKFGNAFLNRFQCSQSRNSVLESLTIIDTPGILSGEKQRLDRGYNYAEIIEWFAEHVDRIILLFDAHKLDISDEFRRVIESLRGYDEKIRIVLNKADMVDSQHLMRVYGALMWGLGKVLQTPEVARVFIGSFWDQPLHFDTNRRLFELEEQDLFKDLQTLPSNAAMRKLNDMIRRCRLAKVHACILSYLRKEMPAFIGKTKKQTELLKNLSEVYDAIARQQNVSVGDFPKLERMQKLLGDHDFSSFPVLKDKHIEQLDLALKTDVPKLLAMIPREKSADNTISKNRVKGGAFDGATTENPFTVDASIGINRGKFDDGWIVNQDREESDRMFRTLCPDGGKLSGGAAKDHMMLSRLPNTVLRKIWTLADVDGDGYLSIDEFALANYLIKVKLVGSELPNTLPLHLVPPAFRKGQAGGSTERLANGSPR